QESRLGERKERVVSAALADVARMPREAAAQSRGPAVVGCRGEKVRPELVAQVPEEARGSMRGRHRIAALVNPPVQAQPVTLCGWRHELPDAHGSRARVGVRLEAAL